MSDGTGATSPLDELHNLFNNNLKMNALNAWMCRDFCQENFVCFVEMIQFKNRVILVLWNQNKEFDKEDVSSYKFFTMCPRSSIVFCGKVLEASKRPKEEGPMQSAMIEMQPIGGAAGQTTKAIDDHKEEEKEISDQKGIEVVIDHEESVQLQLEEATVSVPMTAMSIHIPSTEIEMQPTGKGAAGQSMKTIDDHKEEEKELSDEGTEIEVMVDQEQSVQLEEAAVSSVEMTAMSVQLGGATPTHSVDEKQDGLRVRAPPTSKRAVAFDLSSADSPGTETKILNGIWDEMGWTPSQQNVPDDVEAKYQEVADSTNSDLSEDQKQKIPTIAEKRVEEKKEKEEEQEIEEHLSPIKECPEQKIEEQQFSPEELVEIARGMLSSNCQQKEVLFQPQLVEAPAALCADSQLLPQLLGMGMAMTTKTLLLSKEEEDKFRYSAHMLFKKYVNDMAVLEINISHQLRMRHRQLDHLKYECLTPMQWVRLYDGVIKELEHYILQSFGRMIKKMDIDE